MKLSSAMMLLFVLANHSYADEDSTDKQALQGSWKVTSVTQDGKAAEEAAGTIFTFEESKFTGKGKRTMKGTYTLDPEQSPKQMDFTVMREDGNSLKMPMIYKIEKEQLTLCAPRRPNGDRPTEFKSEAGTGLVLIVMKKQKKDAESSSSPSTGTTE